MKNGLKKNILILLLSISGVVFCGQETEGALLRAVKEGDLNKVRELLKLSEQQERAEQQKKQKRKKEMGEALVRAAEEENVEKVRELLDAKADPNYESWHKMGAGRAGWWTAETPVSVAIEKGNVEIIDLLIKAGLDFNKSVLPAFSQHVKPLMYAVRHVPNAAVVATILNSGFVFSAQDLGDALIVAIETTGNLEIINLLLKAGADPNYTASNQNQTARAVTPMEAVETNNNDVRITQRRWDIVDALIKAGLDLNKPVGAPFSFSLYSRENGLAYIVQHADTEYIVKILKSGITFDVQTLGQALVVAANRGDTVLEIVKMLVEAGADVNFDGSGPLMAAVINWNNNPEIVSYLLSKGALVDTKDSYGYTPLMRAVNPEVATMLIDAGADVNAADNNGDTVLMSAVKMSGRGREVDIRNLVGLLLSKGALINAKNNNGRAALMYAGADMIPMLLDAGAQIDEQDNTGQTALMYSSDPVWEDIIKALLERGADVNKQDKQGRTALMKAFYYYRKAEEDKKQPYMDQDYPYYSLSDLQRWVRMFVNAGAQLDLKDDKGLSGWRIVNYAGITISKQKPALSDQPQLKQPTQEVETKPSILQRAQQWLGIK